MIDMENHPIKKIRLTDNPTVSVIIPHAFKSREENVQGLMSELKQQSFKELEIILIRGISPQGKAINQGVRSSSGNILVIMDDDSRLGHPEVIENLVRVIKSDPLIGMAGASVITSEKCNWFQKMAAKQFPRFQMPVVKEVTDSDFPGHPCAAFSKDVFIKIGMEREDIFRGLDPDLRVRIRKAGYRTVLAPDTWIHHPLPGSFTSFVRLFFRNGFGSAYLQLYHPDLAYDTDETLDSSQFNPKHSFFYRFFRYPWRLLTSLLKFQWIRLTGYSVYILGYLSGMIYFSVSRKPLPSTNGLQTVTAEVPESNPIEVIPLSKTVNVSVVIPHFSRSRQENLKGLLEEIRNQTVKDIEIIIVSGVSPQGRAINEGVRASRGDILVVLDDDSRIGHTRVLENLITVLRNDPLAGMIGASVLTPDTANHFQKLAAKQFPRFNMPVVKEVTDSDLPCHGCVAFPKDVFIKVGMERENILRGLDPDLRVRMRQAGYRVVLAPDTWVYHPLPESLSKFIRTFIRNGYGSAYIQIVHPEINYDTDEALETKNFVPKRSFFYRILRFPFRLAKSLLTFQWIRFLGYSVYVLGYIKGLFCFALLRRREL